MIQRFIPWLKEFQPEAYDQYKFNEDGDYGEHPEPFQGDKFWEAEIDSCTVLIFQSARMADGNDHSEEFWEWNGNNQSWQRMSDEDVPDELLK